MDKLKTFDVTTLAIYSPEAYRDLPEVYKADNCLLFFVDLNKNLCAEYPELGQEYIYIPPDKIGDMQESWTRIK